MMREIIEKWYLRLPFPEKYRDMFYELLDNCKVEPCTVEQYMQSPGDGQQNLLMFLYFCEALHEKYQKYAIEDSVFYDTIEDIVRWTNIYDSVYGKLGLEEINWLEYHMTCRIFKLGRLQFEMKENAVGIHIPEGEPLDYERCLQSFAYAQHFFEKHFPTFAYENFVCHSWLLDTGLRLLLGENSNIIKFQSLFEITSTDPGDAAIRYVFGWNQKRETIGELIPKSSFAKRLQAYVLSGGTLYHGLGIRKKTH